MHYPLLDSPDHSPCGRARSDKPASSRSEPSTGRRALAASSRRHCRWLLLGCFGSKRGLSGRKLNDLVGRRWHVLLLKTLFPDKQGRSRIDSREFRAAQPANANSGLFHCCRLHPAPLIYGRSSETLCFNANSRQLGDPPSTQMHAFQGSATAPFERILTPKAAPYI